MQELRFVEEMKRVKDVFHNQYREKEKNKSGFCIYLGAAGGYAAEFISGGGRDGGP